MSLAASVQLLVPAGEFMASVMASAAQWERRIIAQRTKEALALRRSQGVRLGRPPVLSAFGRTAQVLGRLSRRRRVGGSQAEVDRAAGRLTTLVATVIDPISVAVDKVSSAGARA